jgi:hypothetical protein
MTNTSQEQKKPMIISKKAARALGSDLPRTLTGRAEEVLE